MIFVPDVVPHFLLVCSENTGWSVRDYSSGQLRHLPARFLGRPIEQILTAPKSADCLAFRAPRVPVSDHNFWKRLTDELGKRFLGAPLHKAIPPDRHHYPVVAETEFRAASAHLAPFERDRIQHSTRSSHWTTWNAMQILISAHPHGWWTNLGREASSLNPCNQFCYAVGTPAVEFWKEVAPSDALSSGYDQWRRNHMRQAPRNGRERLRALDLKPLEPPTRVDLCFDGGGWLVFAESTIRHDASMGTPEDPRRNRLIQLADCLVTAAKGRPCALWILARDRSPDHEFVQMMERYRSSPEMFAAELPYHPAEILYKLAQRLTVLRWSDVMGPILDRRGSDDPVTACVRKELRRRIQGAGAARAAGA